VTGLGTVCNCGYSLAMIVFDIIGIPFGFLKHGLPKDRAI
jgi:hypothetical protein